MNAYAALAVFVIIGIPMFIVLALLCEQADKSKYSRHW
jgi:hypothetical protein